MCGLPATVLNSFPKLLISSHQDSGDIPKFNRSKTGGASGGVLPRPCQALRLEPSNPVANVVAVAHVQKARGRCIDILIGSASPVKRRVARRALQVRWIYRGPWITARIELLELVELSLASRG